MKSRCQEDVLNPSASTPSPRIAARVLELCQDNAGEPVGRSSRFDELGLDSLEFVQLVHEIELEFNLALANERLTEIRTVGDLIATVEQGLHA